MKINLTGAFSIFFLIFILSYSKVKAMQTNLSNKIETNRDTILSEMENELDNIFRLWYPLSIDSADGGFFSDINYKWELEGNQNKMIVTQARHVWSPSNAAVYSKKYSNLIKVSGHGYHFLRDVMHDKRYGGFYNLVNRKGEVIKPYGNIIKEAYGNAFAVYGLAAYYKASGDTEALNLAKETFDWLDEHSYDPENGGYFQFLSREGIPFKDGLNGVPPKDQNSSIHILEAFTELYSVWTDETLKERLSSLLHIIRDKMVTKKGYLNLFFQRDLTPVSYRDSGEAERKKHLDLDHVSFGHDIETGYLLLEASDALGIKDDSITLRIAKKMVDHTLQNGWDKKNGGIFDGGYYFKGEKNISIVMNTKEWWAEIEAMNSCLMMSGICKNDKEQSAYYYKKFCEMWHYIKTYLIDHQYGGFFWGGIDIIPKNKFVPKGTIWKGDYHTSRGLINCIRRLKQKE